jgi:low temperature requirement protein LtrA
MNTGLLHLHSTLRYLILVALLVVIIKSLLGWLGKKQYTNLDNKLGLYLFIFTHMQLLIGLILYFVSDMVQFNAATMKNKELRYWAVEHVALMLISVVLITMARITSKKMTSDEAKHKRMLIFNGVALLLILVAITMSGRGII